MTQPERHPQPAGVIRVLAGTLDLVEESIRHRQAKMKTMLRVVLDMAKRSLDEPDPEIAASLVDLARRIAHLPISVPAVEPLFALHICAENDRNGNPQRAFAIFDLKRDYAETIGVWDEGYAGAECVPDRYRANAREAVRVNVQVKEYKSWLKLYSERTLLAEVCCNE